MPEQCQDTASDDSHAGNQQYFPETRSVSSSTAGGKPIRLSMASLLGIGLLIMIVADGVVGLRLVMLARKTRGLPELYFGCSFLSLGVIGYPLSIAARKAAMAGTPVPELLPTALLFQDLASMAMVLATWQTFRPRDRWPRYLAWGSAAVFVTSLLGDSVASGTWAFRDGGVWYELGFWCRAAAYVWAAVEAGRYYGSMRRRLKLGLADPVLTDRFRLWTISACAVCAAFLIFYMGRLWAENVATSVPVLAATSIAGLVAGVTVWLAFVPPEAYLQSVRSRAQSHG
jgi:hypothetical protein